MKAEKSEVTKASKDEAGAVSEQCLMVHFLVLLETLI